MRPIANSQSNPSLVNFEEHDNLGPTGLRVLVVIKCVRLAYPLAFLWDNRIKAIFTWQFRVVNFVGLIRGANG